MPGKSSYFIGNDPSKWHRDIPQFGRVEYQAVYPGIDLVYYGNQSQLEYDFRVAPAADPSQIALSFKGAATRIDSGDLVLATANGDVRFLAPHVYQQDGKSQKAVAGSFRLLADNKVGFSVGDYDHKRELVIDPILTYSTYLGGGGTESSVKIAVDSALNIYLVGTTNSVDFPPFPGGPEPPAGAQDVFIAVINPTKSGTAQLVSTFILGGTGVETDTPAGIAVDAGFNIYVAGSTDSPDFPTSTNAFQTASKVVVPGVHGFLSKLNFNPTTLLYSLGYSTYLAGNQTDHVTGLAIDSSQANAYVTGDTTSFNQISDGFPANANAFQKTSNSPGNPQFFASQINTTFGGSASMVYSTYFGGNNPTVATANGGGIAVDPTGSNVSMYFTGTTNMLPQGQNGGLGFPLYNAQQSCLNAASQTGECNSIPGNTDVFVAKLKPTPGSIPTYSTYLGGSGTDIATAIAVDTSSDAYITGSTSSGDWAHCNGFQCGLGDSTATNAFIAKIGTLVGSTYPLDYFTYLGGAGPDIGNDIKVDSLFAVHVAGSTTSPGLPAVNSYLGKGDAFVVVVATNSAGILGAGDYLMYLGGSQLDQGTGVALDTYNATYVSGNTLSPDLVTINPYQLQLNAGSQDAFINKITAQSTLQLLVPTTSPSPSPAVAAGSSAAFTFNIINTGPDNAYFVNFVATVPTSGLAQNATAKVTSSTGSCNTVVGNTITCSIPTLAVCTGVCTTEAAVEVDVTPSITGGLTSFPVSAFVTANNSTTTANASQTENVVDFSVNLSSSTQVINAGDTATIQANFCPLQGENYSATITPSQTTSPTMVTSTSPTFNPTTVMLAGSACASTTLSIPTVIRPITTGSLLHRGSFYAAWLPIGGLSLVGLGLGAGRKRRRWLIGAVLGLIAGIALLQVGCGSSSSTATTTGGTAAGTYIITINGSAGTGASHSGQISIRVN